MNVAITSNREEFNRVLMAYAKVWTRKDGRNMQMALWNQGLVLSLAISKRMKQLAPAKGGIRAERLAGFKAGEGLKISDRAIGKMKGGEAATIRGAVAARLASRGKVGKEARARVAAIEDATGRRGMGVQALLAEMEIRYREKASGFLSFASRFKSNRTSFGGLLGRATQVASRGGSKVAIAEITTEGESNAFVMKWGNFSNLSERAAEGLTTPKGLAAIDTALADRTADMMEYIRDRMGKDWAKL